MSEVVHMVEIYCDDPRHARGKVAKVAKVVAYSDGGWGQVGWLPARLMDRVDQIAESGQMRDRSALLRSTMGTETIRCKLCGRRLPAYCGPAMRRAVWQFKIDGETRVRLAELAAIISKQED